MTEEEAEMSNYDIAHGPGCPAQASGMLRCRCGVRVEYDVQCRSGIPDTTVWCSRCEALIPVNGDTLRATQDHEIDEHPDCWGVTVYERI